MAGSERIYKFETNKLTIKESKNINLSLLNLENVILALEEQTKKNNTSSFVPYRNSALTLFLKDCFSGTTQISLIFTVNFAKEHFDESISTLKFALRCRKVKIKEIEIAEPDGKNSSEQIMFLNKLTQQTIKDV